MLHIVIGDVVADKLRQAGVMRGDILPWREIYSVGPVFVDMAENGNRLARARYLEQAIGIPQAEYRKTGEAQEAILQGYEEHDEIVLWFEHDLFDQTALCYLLHWFAQRALGRTRLSLLCIGAYPGIEPFRGLGQLTAAQWVALADRRQPVGQRELALGSRAWAAYASPFVEQHIRILHEDTSALPFVRGAFAAHLSRLPSVYNGLGIIEQTTLEAVAEGPMRPVELFESVGGRLNVLGMGDLEYWHRLAKLSEERPPLITIKGLTAFPDYKQAVPSFRDSVIRPTELGRRALRGEAGQASTRMADEWFGGLRLHGEFPWRWDPSGKTVVRIEGA